MRKSSAIMIAAAAGLAALVAATQPISAQSAAQCEAGRTVCQDKCGPASTGSPFLGGPGLQFHDGAIKCLGQCQKTFNGCMRRAGVRGKPAAGMHAGDPPPRRPKSSLSGVYDGNSILNNTGPGFSTQGPAATGSPAGGAAPAPRPGRIN